MQPGGRKVRRGTSGDGQILIGQGMLMIEVAFEGDLVGGGCWYRVREMIELAFLGRRGK